MSITKKAGGTSVEHIMLNELGEDKLLEHHSYAEDGIKLMGLDHWNQYFSFGFVRNPWDRLVSWYTMIQETPPPGKIKLWGYVHQNALNFEEFIVNCTDTVTEERDGYLYRKSFVRPQYQYFTDKSGEKAVSFIGKFENLQDDFNAVLSRAGLNPITLPRLNTTRTKDYKTCYSDRTRALVAERFARDIEYFGYTFD